MGFMVLLLFQFPIPATASFTKDKPSLPETNHISCCESLLSKTVGIHRGVYS